jgi:DNA-directed RNA polymerase subunit RPC12/RpoP
MIYICSFCSEEKEVQEINFGQNTLIRIYMCEECFKDFPKKLNGLPVLCEGKIVGKILFAEAHYID